MDDRSRLIVLVRDVFEFNLKKERSDQQLETKQIISQIKSFTEFYLVGKITGNKIDQNALNVDALISKKQYLMIFLNKEDAEKTTIQLQEASETGVPLVLSLSADDLKKIVDGYNNRGLIDGIEIFIKKPISFVYKFQNSESNKLQNKLQTLDFKKKFELVDEVKKVLDLSDTAERRLLDPGLVYENFHSMIEKLIHRNKIDIDILENELQLPNGLLRFFCENKVSSTISKQAAKKILGYFGLELYLYQYKKYCGELIQELNESKFIDRYGIKPATVSSSNQFELTNIERKIDRKNNAYIYELTFCAKDEEEKIVVSTPKNYIVGKQYEIIGIKGKNEKRARIPQNRVNEKPINCTVTESGRPARNRTIPKEIQGKLDRDKIIRFFKETQGDNLDAAKSKIETLEPHEDIIHSFATYIKTGKTGKIKEFDYTAGLLMHKLKYDPYEAYYMLTQLRNNPSKTKQLLIYRASDPQYQAQKKQ